MVLRQAVFGVVLLTVFGFSDAQRRTWKLPGEAKFPGQDIDSKRFQTSQRKPPQELHGLQHHKPMQPKPNKVLQDVQSVQSQRLGLQHHKPMQPKPVMPKPNQVLQDVQNVQSQQLLQGEVKKVTWKFPQVLQEQPQSPVPFQLRQPVVPESVAAVCGEDTVYVEVKQNLFGTGQLLMPSSIMLGDCGPTGQDVAAHVLVFEYELQACNSDLKMTEEELIYSFVITSTPESYPGTPIIRIGGAVVGIECHYPRKTNVSSNALLPTWIPYASTKVAEEELIFSLSLMTDDWKYERPSNQYFLGGVINIEASVVQFNHIPLRVFVDTCVATAVPDANAAPRYAFIDDYGCLVDAKTTGSSSHFLPQDQSDKLQFQLEAFRFQWDNSSIVYITCFLKVTAASYPIDVEYKACSYSSNRWTAAYGDDQACDCCDASCSLRKGRAAFSEELQVNGNVTIGPLIVEEAVADEATSLV